MIPLDLSRHAQTRMQQRAISAIVVEWLQTYGRVTRRDGANVFLFNRETRKRVKTDVGAKRYARIEGQLDAYIVVSDDGTIVTAGWRYKRFKRVGTRSRPRRSPQQHGRRHHRRPQPN